MNCTYTTLIQIQQWCFVICRGFCWVGHIRGFCWVGHIWGFFRVGHIRGFCWVGHIRLLKLLHIELFVSVCRLNELSQWNYHRNNCICHLSMHILVVVKVCNWANNFAMWLKLAYNHELLSSWTVHTINTNERSIIIYNWLMHDKQCSECLIEEGGCSILLRS